MPLSLEQALGQVDISSCAFRRIEEPGDVLRTAPPGQAHFVAILSGSGELACTHGPLEVHAGQLILLPSGVPPRPAAGMVLAHGLLGAMLLDGTNLFDVLPLPHCLDASGTELFIAAIPELLRESAYGGPGSDAIVTCLARRLVTTLVRDAWPSTTELAGPNGATRYQRLTKIVDLMKKDPGRQYTLEGLASAAAMSRTLFHREFAAMFGVSPLTMLRALRVKRAEDLLLKTDMPIKTIAERLGYRSRSHFCKIFRDASGADPEQFRAQRKRVLGLIVRSVKGQSRRN